jgi:4-aminobutyrate aminotransferase
MGYSEPVKILARKLVATLPPPIDTVFFLNSGSEAIEAALKLARRATGRPAIIAFHGAFHGRTLGATSVTSSSLNYRAGYEPLLPSVYLTPFPAVYRDFGGDEALATRTCMDALERLTSSVVPAASVAAILIEPVQGEGGYQPAPLPFMRELRAFCDANGILLVADEVQTGYARTGRMWAFEHAGIVPDAVCIAKAIANGLRPVGTSRSAGARAPTARRMAATRSPAQPASPCSTRSSARASWRTPRRAEWSSGPASSASRPRTPGSATSAGRGS